MAEEQETVVTELRNQVKQGRLEDDVAIAFHLRGGSGEQAIDESVVVTASGSLHVRVEDGFGARAEGEAREKIERGTVLDLCRLLLQGVENMIPASRARFVPDMLVASVFFAIGSQKETFYFPADEEDCEHRGQPITPQLRMILDRFREIETSCLSDADHSGRRRKNEDE